LKRASQKQVAARQGRGCMMGLPEGYLALFRKEINARGENVDMICMQHGW
jgi:hypothetical protein